MMKPMDVSSVLSAMLRRWYVALVVLVITGIAAVQLWGTAAPQYTASTTLTVVPSQSLVQVRADLGAGESSLGNPFGVQATTVLAALLSESINSGQVVLPASAAGTQVAVVRSDLGVESFFNVVAVGRTPQGANDALQAVTDQSVSILAAIQTSAGAPTDQLYTSLRTRPDGGVGVSYPDRSRMVLGVVLAGLLAAALLSVAVDAAARGTGRLRRRSGDANTRSSRRWGRRRNTPTPTE
ncbi:Wzz/FepE/Etk N-terminal domain-containing protein [Nocardioides flavescens]|uniref:Polysaccharide chain length determinant N-terminal domain-containing protein n=1 Tax=Nocardioides flavescens TaxID=2691959 RepID=A0A6L7EX01_9ACTN|nr:Wzz/FepE/Etk N-terminal domain-containing protein [Nocardioides flavescens]MXG89958.1 hypothetical protein [Nocardioides flavescens]